MLKKPVLVAASLSALTLLAGCGTKEAPGAEPSPQPAADTHGAPSVQKPLDSTAFQKDPCKTLQPEQLQTLGIIAPGQADLSRAIGPGCTWNDRFAGPSDSRTSVTFGTKSSGLKQDYAKKQDFEYFRELPPVEGYPAVAAASIASATPEQDGSCDVDVGVTDDLTFLTQIKVGDKSPFKADPCGRAQQVAGEVVQTLKAGK